MYSKSIIGLALILVAQHLANCMRCPPAQLLSPCVCSVEFGFMYNIECSGKVNLDLKAIFANVSRNLTADEKQFFQLTLSNTAISELVDDVFADISFSIIEIENALNLTKISSKAFNSSKAGITYLSVRSSPLNNASVFEAIRGITNLNYVHLSQTNLTEVPDLAFDGKKLLSITIANNERLTRLGSKAFSQLTNVEEINLEYNAIETMPIDTFYFPDKSYKTLKIDLSNNRLNSSTSFPFGSFGYINRPFILDLTYNKGVTTLNETIFLPILEFGNIVYLKDISLECDCHLVWLTKQREKYSHQVEYAKCQNGSDLFEVAFSVEGC